MPYLGKTPSQATRQRYYLTASGGETSISGTMTTGGTLTFNDGEFVDVSVNGVALVAGTDYNTTTANTIGGLSALSANDQVEIIVYDTFSVFGGNVDGDFNLNNGTMTITTADNNSQLIVKSTDADSSSGPEIELFRDSASPADDDALGQIQFKGKNDAAEELTYGEIDAFIRDASDGTEDAEVRILVRRDGTLRDALSLGPSDVIFNEGSQDVDVRMESDGNSNMFFLDAGNDVIGIGTNSPTNPLTVRGTGGTGSTAPLRVRDESDQGLTIGIFNGGDAALNLEQGDFHLYFAGSNTFEFKSSGDFEINDGNLVIGTAGHGIDFGATANSAGTMSNELLSDYEQGTWSPGFTTNNGNPATADSTEGQYTRIGRMVMIRATITNIDTTGTNSGGQLRINGLPFTCDVGSAYGVCRHNVVDYSSGRTMAYVECSTSEFVRLIQVGDNTSDTITTHGALSDDTTDMQFSITYFTS